MVYCATVHFLNKLMNMLMKLTSSKGKPISILLVEASGHFDFKISPKIFPKDHPEEGKIIAHSYHNMQHSYNTTVNHINSRAIYFEALGTVKKEPICMTVYSRILNSFA